MREFKGTKWPWNWIEHRGYHKLIGGDGWDDLENEVIDDGSAGGEYTPFIDVNSDNAKLIASAPELLDIILSFPGFTDDSRIGDEWIERKDAAINKALGINQDE